MTIETPSALGGKATRHNWALLGGLRFFLALIVLACHVAQHPAIHWNPLAPLEMFSGLAAVFAFFMVSGYSICHSIEEKPEGFYGRRIDRIYPVFFACYLLALVPLLLGSLWPSHALVAPPDSIWTLIVNAVPLQGFLVEKLPTIGPAWSLGVEVFFYALAPWFARCSNKALWRMIGASLTLHAVSAWLGVSEYSGATSALVPACTLWIWLLGWQVRKCGNCPAIQRYAVAFAVAGFSLSAVGSVAVQRLAYATIAVSVAVIVFQGEIKLSPRAARVLRYLGELSYPLYLCHVPVLFTLATAWPALTFGPVYLAAVFLTTAAIYHFIDLPMRARAKASRPFPPKSSQCPWAKPLFRKSELRESCRSTPRS